jgi:hypothetical protein
MFGIVRVLNDRVSRPCHHSFSPRSYERKLSVLLGNSPRRAPVDRAVDTATNRLRSRSRLVLRIFQRRIGGDGVNCNPLMMAALLVPYAIERHASDSMPVTERPGAVPGNCQAASLSYCIAPASHRIRAGTGMLQWRTMTSAGRTSGRRASTGRTFRPPF